MARLVVDSGAEAREIGDAAADVFEVLVVGFGVGLELDRGWRFALADDGCRQIADGDRLIAADVEDLASGSRRLHQGHNRRDDIRDVGEAAELAAVVVNDERLAGEGRIDEAGEDHAIRTGLARADDVKEAANDHREAELTGAGEGQELVDGFAGAVRPAGARGGTKHEVVVFGPSLFRVFAIDLAGAGEKKLQLLAGAVAAAEFVEQELRGIDIALNRLERLTGNERDADGGGEVIDFANAIEGALDGGGIADGAADDLQSRILGDGSEVLETAGGFIVDHGNPITPG